MKKYAKIITLLLLACLLSLTLCACIYGDNDTSGNMTLVILPLEGEAEELSICPNCPPATTPKAD